MNCLKCHNEIEPARIEKLAAKGKIAQYCSACNAQLLKNWKARRARKIRDAVYDSLGMTQVRSASGRIYYE